MNEDAAFIRAIREQPDDETARLVYADWLDDRSDPRAEYLRAEAAWVALQPTDEQYRPLYRRVSQLAAALEPEWFAAVSRMGHRARSEWARVAQRWERVSPRRQRPKLDPLSEWRTAHRRLEEEVQRGYWEREVYQRLCVPADYLAFILEVGGEWERTGDGILDALHSVGRAIDVTIDDVHYDVGSNGCSPPREMWVNVAENVDTSQFMLCCDLGAPRFGEVAECQRYHTWMHSGVGELEPRGSTFLHFLANWSAGE